MPEKPPRPLRELLADAAAGCGDEDLRVWLEALAAVGGQLPPAPPIATAHQELAGLLGPAS